MDWIKNHYIKIQFLLIALIFYNIKLTHAQVVDQSINGVQVGYFGVWLHNETKMSPNWAFRSEIGYESPLNTGLYTISSTLQYGSHLTSANEFPIFLPVLSVEPRWYYNSPKRQGNSRNTFHNSSNYASLAIRYYPEFGAISPHPIEEVDGGIFLIPTWGIRRNLSYRINYELGFGLGIDVYELLTDERSTTDVNFNVHVRLGYKYGSQAFKEN